MIDRRATLRGIGAAGALLALGAVTPATATTKPQALMTEDQQLGLILKKLDSLPAELKNADPKAYPNYKRELDRYLGDTTVVVPSYTTSARLGVVSPNFDFGGCIASLASFVSSSEVPVIQIIALIKKALTIWKSFMGIWNAIQNGGAIEEIGKEAVAILTELLGITDVIESCLA